MGNGTSISNASLDNRRAEWSIPSWCIGGDEVNVTPEISSLVQDSWARVMHSSDAFILAHANEPSLTPLTFFYDKFYSHLFDWCPEIKPMFKRGIRQQGQMLANVIKFIVDNIGVNEKEFKENLTILAKVHNGRGITANHYSVMGMTLIHTIRYCVGEKLFTEEHRHAWIVVYSRMMIVMIPVVVSGETIASDYLAKKAEVDEARASQSYTPGRKSAWNQEQEGSKCPGRKASNSEFSTCPVSRKGSTQLKPPNFANDAEIKSSPSSHTPSVPGKMLVHKPSSIMSSRSSVSSICAMATSNSDTEEL